MKRLSNHSPATQLGSSRSRNWIRICLTPKSLLSLWAGFSFCFCGYFKLCQGLLARWLFNLYPVASLLISKLFSGERTWYRKQASAWERFLEELLAFHVEGGLGLGRGGTQKHTYNWGDSHGIHLSGCCREEAQNDRVTSNAKLWTRVSRIFSWWLLPALV